MPNLALPKLSRRGWTWVGVGAVIVFALIRSAFVDDSTLTAEPNASPASASVAAAASDAPHEQPNDSSESTPEPQSCTERDLEGMSLNETLRCLRSVATEHGFVGGAERQAFANSYVVCDSYPLRTLARQWDTQAHPDAVALAIADAQAGVAHQPAYDGCFLALT